MAVTGIRYYREKAGLTQRELGAALGLDPALASKMEAGLLVPTPDQVEKLVEILKTTPAHLFSQHILAEVAERSRASTAEGAAS